VNWHKINPQAEDSGDDEMGDDEADEMYVPKFHDPATFNPTFVGDLLPEDELDSHDSGERAAFKKMQVMAANHLQIMYREGKLRWPRTRKEIEKKYSTQPRLNFPGAGDLDEV
jgi:hypothetical protein